VEECSHPLMNRDLQANNWLISRSDLYFLGIKVKNTDHGVTTYINMSTSSKSHPRSPVSTQYHTMYWVTRLAARTVPKTAALLRLSTAVSGRCPGWLQRRKPAMIFVLVVFFLSQTAKINFKTIAHLNTAHLLSKPANPPSNAKLGSAIRTEYLTVWRLTTHIWVVPHR
jgi:hypothetical protein